MACVAEYLERLVGIDYIRRWPLRIRPLGIYPTTEAPPTPHLVSFIIVRRPEDMLSSPLCSDPRARFDPVGGSESKPRGHSFNSFYSHFISISFSKMSRPKSLAQLEGQIRNRAQFTPTFSFILSNIYLCYIILGFRLRGSIFKWEAHKHLHFTKCNYNEGILCLFTRYTKQNINSKFNYFVHKICHIQKRNDMHMAGYTLILRNLLYDSALHDLVFFPVYSKPEHR